MSVDLNELKTLSLRLAQRNVRLLSGEFVRTTL